MIWIWDEDHETGPTWRKKAGSGPDEPDRRSLVAQMTRGRRNEEVENNTEASVEWLRTRTTSTEPR